MSAAAMSSRREARPEASARWCATESPAGERQCAHARKRARFASACVAASGRSARKVSPFFTGASATSARPRPSIDTHATRGGEGPSLRASIARVRAIESSSAAAVRADAPPTAAGADPASRSRLARFVPAKDIGTKPSSPRASRNARARSARAPRPLTARESFREQRAQLRRDFASEKGCAVRFLSAYDRRRSRGTRHVLVSSHPKRARVTDLPSIPLTRSSRPVRPA